MNLRRDLSLQKMTFQIVSSSNWAFNAVFRPAFGKSTLEMFQQSASQRQLCHSAAETFWHVHVAQARWFGRLVKT